MKNIEDYLTRTKSAVKHLFNAYNSYWEILLLPERPAFLLDVHSDSINNEEAYENWYQANKLIIENNIFFHYLCLHLT